ncbi:PREDICTED: serine/threonine-protein kinase 17A-like [Priapulus caudatus]|uniref:Serine/threonine-protein kinase 17A-like n=1 Tax=Priapulus caudatus TaxID=37621 RepID=A0ABM1DVI7_PRICU|nr:PREDICTED: serine/threonine-protein kinase 17A-like [Priapulus caudatus]XP_014663959.1 PREDICTED: serine/threonine-protein kinase 17A-like [Priapulus caudatus]
MHVDMIGNRFAIQTAPITNTYSVEGAIARGKFGTVKKIRHRTTGIVYAAKFIRKRRRGEDCRAGILHEIAVHEIAHDHARLITLHDVYETHHEIILVLEYAAGGELFSHFLEEEAFNEKHVIRFMRQLLEGLVFLHDRSIVHLDIKPQNILFTSEYPHGDIKLCDFGLCRLVDASKEFREIVGTPDFVAPEILSYEPITTQTDMWSIGVLAYQMLTGCSPFGGATKQETFLNISQVNLEFPEELFMDVTEQARDFICSLLVVDPSERMTALECLMHPWLWREPPLRVSVTESHLIVPSPRCYRRPHPIYDDDDIDDEAIQPKRSKLDELAF